MKVTSPSNGNCHLCLDGRFYKGNFNLPSKTSIFSALRGYIKRYCCIVYVRFTSDKNFSIYLTSTIPFTSDDQNLDLLLTMSYYVDLSLPVADFQFTWSINGFSIYHWLEDFNLPDLSMSFQFIRLLMDFRFTWLINPLRPSRII